ncbi:DUF1203 domain-containing protein [Pararhizobium sp. IMCC21322]|uniref:DUF1203 domain-containing protein n=1 Tax=Pararhizobium sp. IMCC21322 TaxID=3067903 RepID=UPI0027429210|nr:DUF1203 domain-containing protein [Pararhizobium sp. IMCC21322]
MSFQIHALAGRDFEDLFALSDADLKHIGALRVTADSKPGFPCRVSLQDANIGDELILTNFKHLPENSPYQASHAIYVRKGACQAKPDRNEVPQSLSLRVLSVRGFGNDHLLKEADLVDGKTLAAKLDALFANPAIDYAHIHNAKQGCFAAKATR